MWSQIEITMEKIICSKCGTEILPGYRFCPKCGKVVPLNSFEISKPENIKITPVKQYEESAINAKEKEKSN